MSGGWFPAVHLFSHARGRLEFDATRQCFLPVTGSAPVSIAGALSGAHGLADALASATAAVAQECARLGLPSPKDDALSSRQEFESRADVASTRYVPHGKERLQWIDYQHDVTVADVKLALREGFDAIEHLKRYTTTGMSVDQGKTANLNALLLVAELTGRAPEQVGTTTFRPPYMPVTLGALAGRDIGEFYGPRRLLPAHAEHVALGAHFEEAGGWMRPACYPRSGESAHAAIQREALAVRRSAGLFDASPLGKIEVAGPDAARFLDKFYINNIVTLEQGRSRYGLMLNESGVIIDDGTVARLGEQHYAITTTSGGAGRIGAWLEEWRQCEWPDLEVFVTPVTTQWATFALAGPRAREILAKLPTDIDLAPAAFPHLHVRTGRLCGVATRLYRVSFSGELGFEINVPARYAADLWKRLLEAGKEFSLTPYGIETVLLLRLEKGFLHVGLDTDGTTSPADVGWGDVAFRKKADYIGKRSLTRPDNVRSDRLQLVGLSMPTSEVLVPGAHLRLPGTTEGSDGWVTSAARSPILGKSIAMAMLRGGRNRIGERVTVHELGRTASAEVCATSFYDPKNERLNA
jgi:sarcosine oxidase subunit alpha